MKKLLALIFFAALVFVVYISFKDAVGYVGSLSLPTKDTRLYMVKRVVDGDTIELDTGEKVRYIGINTPETVDPRRPVQCFGAEATKKNKELVEWKLVRLEKDVSDKDKYGRLLRYVYLENNFINDVLIKEGFAQTATYPPDVKFADQFRQSEQYARENNLGLWSKCKNLPAS